MNTLIKMSLVVLLLVVSVSIFGVKITTAHGDADGGASDLHSPMGEVLESGDYDALMNLREETGMPVLSWVKTQNDFRWVQNQYQDMVGHSSAQMPCHG